MRFSRGNLELRLSHFILCRVNRPISVKRTCSEFKMGSVDKMELLFQLITPFQNEIDHFRAKTFVLNENLSFKTRIRYFFIELLIVNDHVGTKIDHFKSKITIFSPKWPFEFKNYDFQEFNRLFQMKPEKIGRQVKTLYRLLLVINIRIHQRKMVHSC